MSWDWADGLFNRFFTASIGAAPAWGVDKTVMAVVAPRAAGFGAFGANAAGVAKYGIFLDSGTWFFGTDFHGGPAVSNTEWQQVCARYNASTTQVSWRSRNTTGGKASWGTWSTLASYSANEGTSATIDALVTGLFNDRSNGDIAAVGVWSGQLADATVDALDVNIPAWRASANVKLVWQMNAISVPPVGGDLIDITGGGATGTAYSSASTPQVSLAADPPGIIYWSPSAPARTSDFFQLL